MTTLNSWTHMPGFSFEEIVEHFIAGQQQLEQLRNLCAQLLEQNGHYQQQSKVFSDKLELATSTNTQLQQDLWVATRDLNVLQRAIARTKTAALQHRGGSAPFVDILDNQRRHLKCVEDALTLQKMKTKQLQSQVNTLEREQAELSQKCVAVSIENNDLKVDLQILRDTADATRLQILHRPDSSSEALATPFVLTLIDGDAYRWSPDLFDAEKRPPHTTPGGYIAHKLHKIIQKYLLQHQTQVPVSSTSIVRVLCNNTNASPTSTYMFPSLHRELAPTFMQQFTESSPLFDYHAVGTGKERVDSKINAMINLFIRNPACHKLFLAVSTDNGFARTLEQYTHDPVCRNKICIVSSGIMGAEIAALQLEEVEWPEIFRRKVPSRFSLPRQSKATGKRGHGTRKVNSGEEKEGQPSLKIKSDWFYKGIATSGWGMTTGLRQRPNTGVAALANGKNQYKDDIESQDENENIVVAPTECGNDGYCTEDGVD